MKKIISVGLILLLSVVLSTSGVDGKWTLMFRQTMPYMFKKNEWTKEESNPIAANFARLEDLENFRGPNQRLTLKIVWPELKKENIWSQTSNPVTKTSQGVDNYKAINIDYTGCTWGGLEYSGTNALLDGSVNSNTWYYAIGTFQKWSGAYPGPCIAVNKVELWVETSGDDDSIPGCDCTDHLEANHLGGNIGACLTQLKGKFWCYINNNAASTCPDKKQSSRGRGQLWWSYKACEYYKEFQPIAGK